MSFASVSGSAMCYPYPSSTLTHLAGSVGVIRRVPEIRGRARGGRTQHGSLPREQGALQAQPAQGAGLVQQGLPIRQVNDHSGANDEREQRRFIRQLLDPYRGAAPFGKRVQVAAERGLDRAYGRNRLGRVDDVVGEQLDLALEIRSRLVEPEGLKTLSADGNHIEPAVFVSLDPPQRRGAADFVQRMHPVDAGLAALADRDHAESSRLRPVEQ